MPETVSEAKSRRKWEVEDAARTLTKAEEIKDDKKLYAEALELMKEQMSNINEVLMKNGGGNLPKAFDKCVADGGRVRTMKVKGGRYMRICFDKAGKSHAGEVRKKKESK